VVIGNEGAVGKFSGHGMGILCDLCLLSLIQIILRNGVHTRSIHFVLLFPITLAHEASMITFIGLEQIATQQHRCTLFDAPLTLRLLGISTRFIDDVFCIFCLLRRSACFEKLRFLHCLFRVIFREVRE